MQQWKITKWRRFWQTKKESIELSDWEQRGQKHQTQHVPGV